MIGWNYAFRGYLTSQWAFCQQSEHPRSTLQGIKQQWLKPVIRATWTATTKMWKARNEVLHSAQGMTIRESTTNSKVRLIYELQDTFARTDHVLFDLPLERRLLQTQQQKKNWLSLVSRYHPTTNARRVGNQQLITTFFNRRTENRQGEPQPLAPTARRDPLSLEDPPNIQRRTRRINQNDKG